MKVFIYENNSGGFTVLESGSSLYFEGKFSTINEVISKFEDLTGLNWNYENSYEGNSCSCCGRRFTLYLPIELEGSDDSYHQYGCINFYRKEEDIYFSKDAVELKEEKK